MESLNVFQALAAGGDLASIAIAYILLRHHTRLTRIETQLEMKVKP